MNHPRTLRDRCEAIQVLVVDVDGVLTDGGIAHTNAGDEEKTFHVRDGSGLKIWRYLGKRAVLITGRTSRLVAVRAAEVGLYPVIQGTPEKLPAFRKLLKENQWHPEEIAFVGDDLPDLPVLRQCGLAVAVADACPEVVANAHYVCRAAGGRGAVRETIELLLHCQGLWQGIVERFHNESL